MYDSSTKNILFDETTIKTSEWNHYVITWEVTGAGATATLTTKLYVNSEFPETDSKGEGYGDVDENFYLGIKVVDDSPVNTLDSTSFYGLIDDFRVYNRVLKQDEINQLFQTDQ